MSNTLLTLYQLCDSNFPIGTFSHSFGFETYMLEQHIIDASTFEQWLGIYLKEQFIYSEGIAANYLYDDLVTDQKDAILHWSTLLNAQIMPKEVRLGNQRMGERFLILARELFEDTHLNSYNTLLKEEKTQIHPVIVFILIAVYVNATKKEALEAYLYSTIAGLVQNAVRAVPIGQTAGQKILIRFQQHIQHAVKVIQGLPRYKFGVTAPGIEIAQMNHQFLYARNFMS